jgi:hypothetical protein
MIYDGGRQSPATTGVYLCFASAPWGPWSNPELIFNDKRDNGLGNYVYSTNATYHDLSLAGPVIGGVVATITKHDVISNCRYGQLAVWSS